MSATGNAADTVIEVSGLTKDYGRGHGIYDIDLAVRRGEVYGYVGTNGSGKTTTIRHLMGFLRADRGTARVLGRDAWRERDAIVPHVGYVPGEIDFPPLATGDDFLDIQAEYLGLTDRRRRDRIVEALQLDPTADLARMSKGMKQKTALVAAFMAGHEVLVLDEPSTGLDPLMRDAFLELVREERNAGHTVFMSSHIFEEMEEVCDRVTMIRDGRVIDTVDIDEMREGSDKAFTLTFPSGGAARAFAGAWRGERAAATRVEGAVCRLSVRGSELNDLFGALRGQGILSLRETQPTLEDIFMKDYHANDAKEHA